MVTQQTTEKTFERESYSVKLGIIFYMQPIKTVLKGRSKRIPTGIKQLQFTAYVTCLQPKSDGWFSG